MTTNDLSGHEQLARRRRYRRLSVGSLLAGMAGTFVAIAVGYPLVGIGLYWLGALGMLAVLWGAPIELFDEREQVLEQRASWATLNLFAVALIVVFPGLVALEEAGVYEMPTAVSTAMWGYVLLYAVFGVVYTAYRYRS